MTMFESLRAKKKPLIAAHRGLALGNIPCNTPAAFDFALANGADIIELDVSVTADGELLVFHPGMEKAHTNSFGYFTEMTAAEIENAVSFTNMDNTVTQFPISRLKDVLLYLKGRCVVNIDKFWTAPEAIAAVIRDCGMEQDVIIKTNFRAEDIENVRLYAPDIPYMPVIWNPEELNALIGDPRLNLVGAEILFNTEDSAFASPDYIQKVHEHNLLLWVNSIVYNYKDVLAAGHNDDISAQGHPADGWGWLADRGYDIIQTDYTGFIQQYLNHR